MTGNDVILTLDAKKELETELKNRTSKLRKEIASELDEARSEGDLSENSWHDAVLDKQEQNELRIKEIEKILRTAKVVKGASKDGSIAIGSTTQVEVVDDKGKKLATKKLELVSATQADPLAGKLSIESPLGKSLVGASSGQDVKFKQPDGKVLTYKILSVT